MSTRNGLRAALALLLFAGLACNMQPGEAPQTSAASPAPSPEPTASTRSAREERPPPAREAPRQEKGAQPTGPTAERPAPLPRGDKVVTLFHTGNVEGSLDPCG